jgi:hypothetical protein
VKRKNRVDDDGLCPCPKCRREREFFKAAGLGYGDTTPDEVRKLVAENCWTIIAVYPSYLAAESVAFLLYQAREDGAKLARPEMLSIGNIPGPGYSVVLYFLDRAVYSVPNIALTVHTNTRGRWFNSLENAEEWVAAQGKLVPLCPDRQLAESARSVLIERYGLQEVCR